jgi:hypothetical protein
MVYNFRLLIRLLFDDLLLPVQLFLVEAIEMLVLLHEHITFSL